MVAAAVTVGTRIAAVAVAVTALTVAGVLAVVSFSASITPTMRIPPVVEARVPVEPAAAIA